MGFFSKIYYKVQDLKPKEMRADSGYPDSIGLAISPFNPIVGGAIIAGRTVRREYEKSHPGAAVADPDPTGGGLIPPPDPPPQYSGGGGGYGGGIPVGLMNLGSGIRQQTPATRLLLSKSNGRSRTTTRKRRAKKTKARTTTKRRRSPKKKARLVKGSAAAKRYMASIRRKRK